MKIYLNILLILSVIYSGPASSTDNSADQNFRQRMQQLFPNVEITSIKPTPMTDIYQVAAGNEYIYISKDGRYLIQGDLIDIEQQWNLTEQARTNWRKQQFASIKKSDMITFEAKNEQHAIYVFTDIDCGYCRKLHAEIDKLNDKGVTVHYLAYPALGEYTKGWARMAEIWCSDDRNNALTRAKQGERDSLALGKTPDDILVCSETIKKQYELANIFDVIGTPALYLENGVAIEGYMPADKLTRKIEEMKALSDNITYKM